MGLIEKVKNAGSDSLEMFGGSFEGGYHIQQDPEELAGLIEALQGYKINNYLQIGCAAGGTERFIVESLGIKYLTVIDNGEHPKFKVWVSSNKIELEKSGIKIFEHIGDSHDDAANEFLSNQRQHYELIGIDGDHSPAGVRMDWKLIEPCLRPGVLVWFHDINSSNLPIGQRGALEVWNVVKNKNKIVYETFSKFGIGMVEIV
jgi:predicted O-methyltransferase YrrM